MIISNAQDIKRIKKILLIDTLTSYFHYISQIEEGILIDMAWKLRSNFFTSGFKSNGRFS